MNRHYRACIENAVFGIFHCDEPQGIFSYPGGLGEEDLIACGPESIMHTEMIMTSKIGIDSVTVLACELFERSLLLDREGNNRQEVHGVVRSILRCLV